MGDCLQWNDIQTKFHKNQPIHSQVAKGHGHASLKCYLAVVNKGEEAKNSPLDFTHSVSSMKELTQEISQGS
jgi:hypothetical protein